MNVGSFDKAARAPLVCHIVNYTTFLYVYTKAFEHIAVNDVMLKACDPLNLKMLEMTIVKSYTIRYIHYAAAAIQNKFFTQTMESVDRNLLY